MEILLPQEAVKGFLDDVTETTGAKAQIQKLKDTQFALVDGQVELFTRKKPDL